MVYCFDQIKALEISENRWKPSKPTDDEEKVYKAVKGVLNKLTLEKFEKLYKELLEVGIRSPARLFLRNICCHIAATFVCMHCLAHARACVCAQLDT